MQDTNIWREIQYIKNPNHKAYFQWRNKIQNIKRDYGALSEEEFLEYVDGGSEFMKYMKRWESSPEYKRLVFLLKEDSFATDLLETYNKVKELALTGDSTSIKNMLMLQKEIKKYRNDIDSFNSVVEEKEEDDGLEI